MQARNKFNIDPELTLKFFATTYPETIAQKPTYHLPLPPANPKKLKEFLSSAEGEQYKTMVESAMISLRELLVKYHTMAVIILIVPKFCARHLRYSGDDEDINEANLELYRTGIPTFVAMIEHIKTISHQPEKWLTPIRLLLQDIEHICGPGIHTQLTICFNKILACENLPAHLRNIRETLIEQHIANIVGGRVDKDYDIHFINAIHNFYASFFGLEIRHDANMRFVYDYGKRRYKLAKFRIEFANSIQEILTAKNSLNALIRSSAIPDCIEAIETAAPIHYAKLIDALNIELACFGNVQEQYTIRLTDLFILDDNDRIIQRKWQHEFILLLNIKERLKNAGYLATDHYQKINLPDCGEIYLNPNKLLADSYIAPTYQLIDMTNIATHVNHLSRINLIKTDDHLLCIDKLRNIQKIIAGVDSTRSAKLTDPRVRTSYENQARSHLQDKSRMIQELNLSDTILPNNAIDNLLTILSIEKEPNQPLLVFLVDCFFNHYSHYEIIIKKFLLSNEQLNEIEAGIKHELYQHPMIKPYVHEKSGINLMANEKLFGILESLPHDVCRYKFLKLLNAELTPDILPENDFLRLSKIFSKRSFSLIGLYLKSLDTSHQIKFLDMICQQNPTDRESITHIEGLNSVISAITNISPFYLMQLVNINLLQLLKMQLNHTQHQKPLVRFASCTKHHLPIHYLMIALLTFYIQQVNIKINKLGAYQNHSSSEPSYIGQAEQDLMLLKNNHPIPYSQRLTSMTPSTPLFFRHVYTLYEYLVNSNSYICSDRSLSLFALGNIKKDNAHKAADAIIKELNKELLPEKTMKQPLTLLRP